MHNFPQFSDI